MHGDDVLSAWLFETGPRFQPVRSPPFELPPGNSTLWLRADAGPSNEVLDIWLERAALEAP